MDDYEWITTLWPAEPDPYLRAKAIPYSVDRPLLFHMLTTLPGGEAGTEMLLSLMRRGVALLPRDRIPTESWGESGGDKGKLFAFDAAAGDDQYVFTSPANVVGLEGSDQAPALAFDAIDVADRVPIAIRPFDLEPYYGSAMAYVNLDTVAEWSDEEDDPDRAMEEYAADVVAETLQDLAQCATQTDPDKALKALLLYNQALRRGSLRVPGHLMPECDLWEDTFVSDEQRGAIRRGWEDLGDAHGREFPWSLVLHAKRPEVLVAGALPLCWARFYRGARGRWLPVGEDICRAGMESIRRNGPRGFR